MHILTLGIIVGIFTFVKSTPLPTDPDSDSDSDSIQIVPNPDPNSYIDSQNSVQILPQDPIDSQDQQPNFLPDGVTGHEIISQTPDEIQVFVVDQPSTSGGRAPPTAADQPSTSSGRRGPTLKRSFNHLAACLKRTRPRVDHTIRINIGK